MASIEERNYGLKKQSVPGRRKAPLNTSCLPLGKDGPVPVEKYALLRPLTNYSAASISSLLLLLEVATR
jgi:hypothetical protein